MQRKSSPSAPFPFFSGLFIRSQMGCATNSNKVFVGNQTLRHSPPAIHQISPYNSSGITWKMRIIFHFLLIAKINNRKTHRKVHRIHLFILLWTQRYRWKINNHMPKKSLVQLAIQTRLISSIRFSTISYDCWIQFTRVSVVRSKFLV